MPSEGVHDPGIFLFRLGSWTYFSSAVGYSATVWSGIPTFSRRCISLGLRSRLRRPLWNHRFLHRVGDPVRNHDFLRHSDRFQSGAVARPCNPDVAARAGFGDDLFLLERQIQDIKTPFLSYPDLAVHNADHLSHQLVAGKYRILAAINPMTGIIEAFRFTVIPGKQLDIWLLMFSIGISLLMFVIGLIYFRKTEREFADIV